MRIITALTGISALLIAGCAAYFSVTGLGLLFSGATTEVIIMASALEIGKLVAASYLHNYWNATNSAMKSYMIIGVIMLITITSAGIFGFLSNAYTQTQINVNQVDSKVELYEAQKERFLTDIPRWESRIQILSDNRTAQEERYNELVAGNNWVNAKTTANIINESNVEINKLNDDINIARAKVDSLDQLIFQVRQENIEVEREIGGFRFVAAAFGVSTDTIVKWFILLLIFIFDPLAVLMVIAFNTALATDRKDKIHNDTKRGIYKVYNETPDEPEQTEAPDEESNNTVDEKTLKGVKVHSAGGDVIMRPKYKDKLGDNEFEEIYDE